MITAQPDGLVVTVVITKLNGTTAFGYIRDDGESVCVIDRAFLDDDPDARAAAYAAFVEQAALQVNRAS